MVTRGREVVHDHGITREIYEVMRVYGDTLKRLKNAGTDEDGISEDFYRSAMKVYAETMASPDTLAMLRSDQKREALFTLAEIALRWARKVRVDTVPVMHVTTAKRSETRHDA